MRLEDHDCQIFVWGCLVPIEYSHPHGGLGVLQKTPLLIRRSILALVLGDLNGLGGFARQPLCGGLLRACADHLVSRLSVSLPTHRAEVEGDLADVLKHDRNVFLLLSDCTPRIHEGFEQDLRIAEATWEEWLRVCWGHDGDTLSILAYLPHAKSASHLAAVATELPIVPMPVDPPDARQNLIDAHIHAGSMCPPAVMWAHYMNTGVVFKHDSMNEPPHYECIEFLREYRLREYVAAARILLAALLQLTDTPPSAGQPEQETARQYELTELVVRVVNDGADRDELASFLAAHLQGDCAKRVAASGRPGELIDRCILGFLKLERECVSRIMWLSAENRVSTFVQELLLTYLRCKNHWFQVSSGLSFNIRGGTFVGTRLKLFKIAKQMSWLGVVNAETWRFKEPLAQAVNSVYRALGEPCEAHVRLSYEDVRYHSGENSVKLTLKWLDIALDSIRWRLVLCLRRNEDFNSLMREAERALFDADRIYGRMRAFVDLILEDQGHRQLVDGLDIVGPERDFLWAPHIESLVRLRDYIKERLCNDRCFIAFHCGEDTCCPLKGISDIWRVVSHGNLGAGDRLAHGLDVLDPTRNPGVETVTMYWWQWNELESSIPSLIDSLDDEGQRERARHTWEAVADSLVPGPRRPRISATDSSDLAQMLDEHLMDLLISRGVILEVCPTSNWRISGVASPVRHPAGRWIARGGCYLVGTDDPAVLPCTIHTEHYCVQRSLEFD